MFGEDAPFSGLCDPVRDGIVVFCVFEDIGVEDNHVVIVGFVASPNDGAVIVGAHSHGDAV